MAKKPTNKQIKMGLKNLNSHDVLQVIANEVPEIKEAMIKECKANDMLGKVVK